MIRTRSVRALATLSFAAAALTASPASADHQEPPPRPPALPAPAARPAFGWADIDVNDILITVPSLVAVGFIHAGSSPNRGALIGPSFDRDHPEEILSAAYADRIGKPHKTEDTVPVQAVFAGGVVVAAGLGLAAGLHGRKHGYRYLYDTLAGFAEAISLTLVTTEAMKSAFGRLRPDFQDRVGIWQRCQSMDIFHPKAGCSGFTGDAQEVFYEGRVSFPSGHTSLSFAIANYGALAVGGQLVWGEHASAPSRAAGVLVQAGLLGTAAWIGATRVMDHRHNATDVFGGMAVGVLVSSVAYWRRFDLHGRPRRLTPSKHGASVDLTTGPGDVGAAVRVRF